MELPRHQLGAASVSFKFTDHAEWPRTPLGEAGMRGAGWLMRSALRGVEYLHGLGLDLGIGPREASDEQSVQRWLEAHAWPTRRLQIGVIEPGGWGRDLLETSGVLQPDWIAINQDELRMGTLPDALDAVLTCYPDGRIDVRTCEHVGHDAAWYDWSNERPLSYPSVFPVRVDCSQLTLHPSAGGQQADVRLGRLLIECAALLSRHPARLRLDDQLAGRGATGAGAVAENHSCDALLPIMRRLVELLSGWESDALEAPAARAAARLMSAWAASACSPRVDDTLRRVVSDVASSIVQDEPETLLRVAATRLADGDDTLGLDALQRAAMLLMGKPLQNPPDQIVYVLNELQTAPTDPFAIGRVAAGLTLVGATTSRERFGYFRDDVLDEVRLSGILVDLEQQQLVLLKTLAMLERVLGIAGGRAQGLVTAHEQGLPAPAASQEQPAVLARTWTVMRSEPSMPARASTRVKEKRSTAKAKAASKTSARRAKKAGAPMRAKPANSTRRAPATPRSTPTTQRKPPNASLSASSSGDERAEVLARLAPAASRKTAPPQKRTRRKAA